MRGLPKGRPLFTFEGSVILDADGQPIIPEDGTISPPIDGLTVARTLERLPKVLADMVRFQRATGCRPGEACNIRPKDIDQSASEIWIYRPPHHKTRLVESDDGRVIAIGKNAQNIIRPYLDREAGAFCFSPRDSERLRRNELSAKRKTPLTYGNRVRSNRKKTPRRQPGDVYTVSAYNKAIKRAVNQVNEIAEHRGEPKIEPWSANQLRRPMH